MRFMILVKADKASEAGVLPDGRMLAEMGKFNEELVKAGVLLAGFWLWQVKSKEEAIEWVKQAPFDGGTEIEIRQVFEAEDFREQEESMRAQAAAKK